MGLLLLSGLILASTIPPTQSAVASAGSLLDNQAAACKTSSSKWQNSSIPSQTGTFTVTFDATPNQAKINGVTGLSAKPVTAFTGLAAITRFNEQGFIDARNGSTYQAATQIPYKVGVRYHFRLVIDVPHHTYDIFVTPANGTEKVIGTAFAFRTEPRRIKQAFRARALPLGRG
ncbi:MAG TPA: hypothetical protein VHK27_10505 [Gammaproteobacteria bacterium]|nr:hypothetical protein [Gammaproteobacteria bacterium]